MGVERLVLRFLLIITYLLRARCDRFIFEKSYDKKPAILIVNGKDTKGEAQTVLENAGLWDAFDWKLLYRYSEEKRKLTRQILTRVSDYNCLGPIENLEERIYDLWKELGRGLHFECFCFAVQYLAKRNPHRYYAVFLHLSTAEINWDCTQNYRAPYEKAEILAYQCRLDVVDALKVKPILIKGPWIKDYWLIDFIWGIVTRSQYAHRVVYKSSTSISKEEWDDFRGYRRNIREIMKEEGIVFPTSDALCYADVPERNECGLNDINICKRLTVIPGKEQEVEALGFECGMKKHCRKCFDPIPTTTTSTTEETTTQTDGTTVSSTTLSTTSESKIIPTWVIPLTTISALLVLSICALLFVIWFPNRSKQIKDAAVSVMSTISLSVSKGVREAHSSVHSVRMKQPMEQPKPPKTKEKKPGKAKPSEYTTDATVTRSNPFLKTQVATSPLPGTGSNVPPTPERTESAPFLATQKATLPLPSRLHTTVETRSSPFLATQKATLPLTGTKTKSIGGQSKPVGKKTINAKKVPVQDPSETPTDITENEIFIYKQKAKPPIEARKSVARKSKLVGKQVKVEKNDPDEVVKKQKKRRTKKG